MHLTWFSVMRSLAANHQLAMAFQCFLDLVIRNREGFFIAQSKFNSSGTGGISSGTELQNPGLSWTFRDGWQLYLFNWGPKVSLQWSSTQKGERKWFVICGFTHNSLARIARTSPLFLGLFLYYNLQAVPISCSRAGIHSYPNISGHRNMPEFE